MEHQPLADKMRPESLDDMVGQEHLFGRNGILRRMLDSHRISNMIFYGPPGVGKTTAARIVAKASGLEFHHLNATTASLSDVKEIVTAASNVFGVNGVLLYLDEIQYFNKKQQQSLLSYMEDGRVILIASTTENPNLYIYGAILSRSSVFEFKPVSPQEISRALERALAVLNREFGTDKTAADEVLLSIAEYCRGDVRCGISILENAYYISDGEITKESALSLLPTFNGTFDKAGDVHYDLMSCLQKSIRGSDPDAAIFYLAKMLAGGDLLSPCRRLQVIASEDIGAAYPLAAVITRACVESAKDLGLPEAALPLANAVVMLATAPKSNTAYAAYHAALADVEQGLGRDLPKHLRGPGYEGYLYPHDYPHDYVAQQYLPDDLKDRHYYRFGDNKTEQLAKQYYDMIRDSASAKKR
ncbi:MAG: replication-associated recombination protein A [Eubacteriales bacterium]